MKQYNINEECQFLTYVLLRNLGVLTLIQDSQLIQEKKRHTGSHFHTWLGKEVCEDNVLV